MGYTTFMEVVSKSYCINIINILQDGRNPASVDMVNIGI